MTMIAKRFFISAAIAFLALTPAYAGSDKLILLHTNDVHSQIDPDDSGLGGALRKKAFVDSVRQANDNVLLIDLGDAVQGTLYFTLYGGEAEHKAMNAIGYDLAILGNHDFDNGMTALAENLRKDNATWITTNYDIRGTELDGLLVPYVIKEYDGKKIAFIGINLNPEGMISTRNYQGIKYTDINKAANATAWHLKHNERADMVIALTHIGYEDPKLPSDVTLAASSEDIDVIIGGHSHTLINPADSKGKPYKVKNLNGEDVLIAQLNSTGTNIGEIDINLDNLTAKSSVHPIDSRYDNRIDPAMQQLLDPYRHKVDSLMSIKVAKINVPFDKQRQANLFADMIKMRGKELNGGSEVDFSIINNGGIRRNLPAGQLSAGHIMMTLPFDNYVEVIRVSGSDLLKTFNKMVERGINGVSQNVEITFDPADTTVTSIKINGKPLELNKTYTVATLDYLANGGDYLQWLKNGEKVSQSDRPLRDDIIMMLKKTKKALNPDAAPRIRPE